MATPNRKLRRISAIFVLVLAALSSGCAARAEYVYDEPVVYRREPVYAPPPVVVYHEHDHYHPPPRAYRAPSYRGRVGVYRAPVHVHRPPPSHHDHHHGSRHDHDHGRHR
jgi:hypothetical protein